MHIPFVKMLLSVQVLLYLFVFLNVGCYLALVQFFVNFVILSFIIYIQYYLFHKYLWGDLNVTNEDKSDDCGSCDAMIDSDRHN